MRIQDKLTQLRNKRGFTLVELMIVVAIIGVLAALAIYGVRKYLANAKTAEARMSIGRITKDATTAFERENMTGTVLTPGNSVGITHKLCPNGAKVPSASTSIQNKKYQSKASEWSDGAGWSCLKFSMSDPQYFMYSYASDAAGQAGTAAGTFTATANGDLDGDGTLSSFTMGGTIFNSSNELVLTVTPTITETNPEE